MVLPLTQPRRSASWLMAAAVVAALVPLSWRHWASPFVDFGRELYAAWRLAEGDVLHADVAWFNGPLAPWWNGWVFAILGDSLLALVAVNLALLVLLLGMSLVLAEAMFDRWTGVAAALVIPALFGLGQALSLGNYNFVTPYSHDLTHGVILGLVVVVATWRAGLRPGVQGLVWDAAGGAAVGAAFLTKPETFLAAAGAWLVGLGLGSAAQRSIARSLPRLAVGLAAAGAVLGAAFLKLRSELPPGCVDPAHALAGAWPYLLDGRVRELPFYGNITGLGDPGAYGWALIQACLRYAGLLGACGLALWSWRRWFPGRAPWVFVAAGAFLQAAWFQWAPWFSVARPLPLLVGAVAGVSAWRACTGPSEARTRAALRASFAVFALGLLAKTPLNTRWAHYGFALALPGTLLAIGAGVHDLPRLLARRRSAVAGTARLLALAFWVVAAGTGVQRSLRNWTAQSATFGLGSDVLHARPELAGPLQDALDWLAPRIRPEQTLLVLPEGVMLNYQLRVKSPTPYVNFMPPELLFWGEAELLETLRAAQPDYVVLVHKDVREYGYRAFGDDYGAGLYRWVRGEHSLLATYGAAPFMSPAFGVAVYARRAD